MNFINIFSKRPKWTITLPHLPLFPSTSGQMTGRVEKTGKIDGTSTLPHPSTLPVCLHTFVCFVGKCGRVWKSTIFNPSRLSTSYNSLKSGRVEELLGGVPVFLFFLAAALKTMTPHIWGYVPDCGKSGYPWRIDANGKIVVDDESATGCKSRFFYSDWPIDTPLWTVRARARARGGTYGRYTHWHVGGKSAVSRDVGLGGAGLAASASWAHLPGVWGRGVAERRARAAALGSASLCGL
jgi:hypothetical protein